MNKREVIKTVEKWRHLLGLHNWEIVVNFEDIKEKKTGKGCKDYISHASVKREAEYLMATITFDKSLLRSVEEETVIHELIHLHTAELTGYANANLDDDEWITYFEEKLVSQLARIMLRLKQPPKYLSEGG